MLQGFCVRMIVMNVILYTEPMMTNIKMLVIQSKRSHSYVLNFLCMARVFLPKL